MTHPQETTTTAPRRVVVAEDESLIRLDIVEILRDNGFEVVGEAGDGETAVVPDSDISIQQQQGSLQFVEGADLMEVVDALNALGATPQELMSILEALKASGALRAELEII